MVLINSTDSQPDENYSPAFRQISCADIFEKIWETKNFDCVQRVLQVTVLYVVNNEEPFLQLVSYLWNDHSQQHIPQRSNSRTAVEKDFAYSESNSFFSSNSFCLIAD